MSGRGPVAALEPQSTPDPGHPHAVGPQRGERRNRLDVVRLHLDAEQTSDTLDQPNILGNDVHDCDVGADLGEREAVEAKTTTDVQNPFAGDRVGV